MNHNTDTRRHLIRAFALTLVLAVAPGVQAQQAPSPTLSTQELKGLITTAKTPADHQKIAAYYRQEAQRLRDESSLHRELAETYRKSPSGHEQKHPNTGQTAGHCQYLADTLGKAAKRTEQLAQSHEAMAK